MLIARARTIIVTSPAQSHPSTEIIWKTIDSLPLLEGELAAAPITVVCDGCRPASQLDEAYAARLADRLAVHSCRFSKRGIVTDEVASNYEAFKVRLAAEASAAGYSAERLSILTLPTHHGFAFAVKEGLQAALAAGASHALVVQHDRAFCRRMHARDVGSLFDHFEAQPTCRYVGFPSGTSKNLAQRTANEYKLHALLKQRSYDLGPGLSLRPSIFYYDSNHLVDCRKALELYEPYKNASPRLRARLGGSGVNRFRLRRGDFTEERFGVEQRNLLASLREEPALCVELFDWFGTYLVEEVLSAHAMQEAADCFGADEEPLFFDRRGRVTFVDHIDARGMVPPSQRRAGSLRRVGAGGNFRV